MNRLDKMPTRMPLDATFELTVRCNLKCKMCLFRHDDSENKQIMMKEKTAKEWIDMAKQAADTGTLSLLITGGEPLIRPDFPEIYEAIYKMGFFITLYTNATMISEKIKNLLRKYPPHKVGITIYGSSPEVYEKVSGNGDAFYRLLEGIRFLKTLPSRFEARTTIIQDNYDDIYNIEELVKNEIGPNCTLTHSRTVYKPVRGACGDVDSCRLTPKQNVRLYLRRELGQVKEKVEKEGLDIERIQIAFEGPKAKPIEKDKPENLTLLGCSAGMDSYTISWDGKLLACQILGNFYTEPFEVGFQKAWNEFPFKVEIPKKFDKKCDVCKNRSICNACYACRYAETGDLGGAPTYVCKDLEELTSVININEK